MKRWKDKAKNKHEYTSNLDVHKKVGSHVLPKSGKYCILHDDQQKLFQKRFDEGYDNVDESPTGQLWQIYKAIRTMMSTELEVAAPQSPSSSISSVAETPSPSTSPRDNAPSPSQSLVVGNVPSTNSMSVSLVTNNFPSSTNTTSENRPSTSGQVTEVTSDYPTTSDNSPSARRQLSFEKFEYSPFKHYLKISDRTIITRKVTKTKPKTPSAISGSEYLSNLRKQQDKKENEIKEKEKRKKEREENKNNKASTNKRNKRPLTDDEAEEDEQEEVLNEEDIIYASTDDEDLLDIEMKNVCGACEGDEGWDDGDKWLGCNSCDRWFHKTCLSVNFDGMTKQQLKRLEFVCPKCCK